MQPETGNILIIYGHGAVVNDETFDFRRPDAAKAILYAWTREGIEIWDTQMKLVADEVTQHGTINEGYATRNSSRIGGTILKDLVVEPPVGLHLPNVAGLAATAIPALGATVYHNAPVLAASTRMVFMMNIAMVPGAPAPAPAADHQPQLHFSTIITDPNFSGRPLDILWCACKGTV
jgi:hypothetical protein